MTAPQPSTRYQSAPPPEYTYEQYLADAAAVLAALAATVGAYALPFQAIALTRRDWLSLLAPMYPVVEAARREMSALARRFYDSERARQLGPVELPVFEANPVMGPDGRPIRVLDDVGMRDKFWERFNILLAPYEPDWFEEAMDAVVLDFAKPNATDGALTKLIGTAVKEAENGARRTTMWAVDDDPGVLGWARVEGNENVGSCGFCAMLISRGPVYKEAGNSGLDLDNASAVEIWRQAEAQNDSSELDALMTRWHPNCDCKVVPVFDRANWPGRDQYIEMQRLWNKVTKGLNSVNRSSSAASSDALNAFRRAIEKGERDQDNILRFPNVA